jgi:hypothetical protein
MTYYEIEMVHTTDGKQWKRKYTVEISANDRKPVSQWQRASILKTLADALNPTSDNKQAGEQT